MTKELNTRGLLCPMPVIKTQEKVNRLNQGDCLRVFCTDPGTLHDIPAWCRVNGHKIVSQEEKDSDFIFVIEVGPFDK